MTTIRNEKPSDSGPREALLDRCFGRDRTLKISERLRRGRLPAERLAFAAVADDGSLIGTVRLWSVIAGSAGFALFLGPLAVTPERQREGVGGALMTHALAASVAAGHGAILLVGDASYYSRFGFSADFTTKLYMPGPVLRARFLARELMPDTLLCARGRITAAGQHQYQSSAQTYSFKAKTDFPLSFRDRQSSTYALEYCT